MEEEITGGFDWHYDERLRVATRVGAQGELIAYATRNAKSKNAHGSVNEPIDYVGLVVRGVRLAILNRGLSKDLLISLEEFKKRAVFDYTGGHEALKDDLKNQQVKATLWNRDGNPLSQQQLSELRSFPLTQVLLLARNPKSQPENYIAEYHRLWARPFEPSIRWAAVQRSVHIRERTLFDVLSRYFVPETETTMYFKFKPGIEPTEQQLKDIKSKFKVSPKTVTEPKLEWKPWFNNPLGLYETWIDQATYNKLVSAQTGGGTATWPLPSRELVQEFNDELSNKNFKSEELEGRRMMWNSTRSWDSLSLPMWHGQKVLHFERVNPQTIMGESANKWAISDLNWTPPSQKEPVVAEWLHIISHRFEPNTGDRYGNIIFGTKPCNTTMMRAEAAVIQLLDSKKIYELEVNAKSVGFFELGIMSYTHWAATRLEYEIVYQTNETNRLLHNPPAIEFNPFSRLCPLRLEYELDKIVLKKYLDKMEHNPVVGSKPGDLLRKYKDVAG
ncbi:unnamed protein product [Rhizoctonia solani]|uniref:Uncharacterized protein n=1 Tax=Rhizoctonia solani TaxID=456999 RepID=A0A8H3GJC6_9AGAM|nr:unnamed protein product [Rhizoctonia solani]